MPCRPARYGGTPKVQLFARGAVTACLIIAATGSIRAQNSTGSQPAFLPQGWTASERDWFYTVSQGSQMMPYSWFMALERAADDKPFAGELTGFGYLPNPKSARNPDGLPVGFSKDVDRFNRSEWIGLTCSACHTNQVNSAGRLYQIDGGPTDADMFQLIDGVAEALAATVVSKTDPKFVRFVTMSRPTLMDCSMMSWRFRRTFPNMSRTAVPRCHGGAPDSMPSA